MAKVIQVRGVPDEVHAVLTRRSAAAGLSLSDYVLRELEVVAARDANEDLLRELAILPSRAGIGAEAVRAERDRRDADLGPIPGDELAAATDGADRIYGPAPGPGSG